MQIPWKQEVNVIHLSNVSLGVGNRWTGTILSSQAHCLMEKGAVPTSKHHMCGGPRKELGCFRNWEGTSFQPRWWGSWKVPFSASCVWWKLRCRPGPLKPLGTGDPMPPFPACKKAAEALRPREPITMGSKGKEKCKIRRSKWPIKCLQNALWCHSVDCISTHLFHA